MTEPMQEEFWGDSMWIDFYLNVKGVNFDKWTSVFRFTNDRDKNRDEYGNRCPGVFVHPEKVYIGNAVNGEVSHDLYIRPEIDFLVDVPMHISISQNKVANGSVIYQVKMDGKSKDGWTMVNTQPVTKFMNPKLMLSDKHYDSFGPEGTLRELRFMKNKISKFISKSDF